MKSKILETSLKQFLKYGIREMSIQKLIGPLGISTKTVYKYFENKEEILEEALRLYYVRQYNLMEVLLRDQNVVPLLFDIWYKGIVAECKINKVFFQDLHYYYPELEKKIEATISKRIRKQFIQIIQNGIKEGVFRKDTDPEILLEAIGAVYVAIARQDRFKKFRASIPGVFLNTIAVFIRGFCTHEGIQQLEGHITSMRIFQRAKVAGKTAAAKIYKHF